MTKDWGIYCTVSGGVTGTRSSWLRTNGEIARFATEAEAEEHAVECRTITKGNSVRFFYDALPLNRNAS